MVTLYMLIMRLYGIKRLENENNGELILLDTSSWRATKKHSAGRSLPTPVIENFPLHAKIFRFRKTFYFWQHLKFYTFLIFREISLFSACLGVFQFNDLPYFCKIPCVHCLSKPRLKIFIKERVRKKLNFWTLERKNVAFSVPNILPTNFLCFCIIFYRFLSKGRLIFSSLFSILYALY